MAGNKSFPTSQNRTTPPSPSARQRAAGPRHSSGQGKGTRSVPASAQAKRSVSPRCAVKPAHPPALPSGAARSPRPGNVSTGHSTRCRSEQRRRAVGSFLVTFLITMAVVLPCALGVGFYWRATHPADSTGPASAAQSLGAGGSADTSSEPENSPEPAVLTVDLSGLNSREGILLERGVGTLGKINADETIYSASLTKMMTVLLAAEAFDNLDAPVTLGDDLFGPLWAANASMAGFEPGETVAVRDLLYGALLPSGAECCAAIAVELDGSEEAFALRMNRRAQELGMENTHFVNATGLQDAQHVSTVRDLAFLLDAALDNPTFREVFTAQRYSTQPTNLHPDGITVSSSVFSLMQDADLGGMTLLGGKTGFTDEAGLCLATLAGADGEEYILVTAGAPGQSHTNTAHVQDAAAVYRRLSRALED